MMTKQVVLTGLRANNDLHLGHYLGVLLPVVDMATKLAGEYQISLFVPDLHSFTTPIDHKQLQNGIMQNLRVFIAAGLPLDNPDIHIYRQSYISAHSELTWILDCFTGFGEMSRMTQFKDKSAKLGDERISVGLFNYPVLMAADILLYNASYVPLGDDQSQHLEFTRDIAERMNKQFGKIFVVPEPVQKQHDFFSHGKSLRIRDLVNPKIKMSKSDESGKGVIFLTDTPETAKKKIMSATTDSMESVAYNYAEQPGISNLLDILALLSGMTIGEVCNKYVGNNQYGPLKQETADVVVKFLKNFQSKLNKIDDKKIQSKLISSENIMTIQANTTLHKVHKAVGLRPNNGSNG